MWQLMKKKEKINVKFQATEPLCFRDFIVGNIESLKCDNILLK